MPILKMLTGLCGPDFSLVRGDEREFDEREASSLIRAGFAVATDDFVPIAPDETEADADAEAAAAAAEAEDNATADAEAAAAAEAEAKAKADADAAAAKSAPKAAAKTKG